MRGFVRFLAIAIALIALSKASSLAQAPRAPSASNWNLPSLMASLHQVRSSTAGFVEIKYLRLLNQAQRSSGRLTYIAPDRLQKDTIEPVPGRLSVNGDRLTIEMKGEAPKDVSLRDYWEIAALIESIRATLAGDLVTLTRYFEPTLDGDARAWVLTLAPREPKLRDLVATIRIAGAGARINEIDTTEADGDRTNMAISPDVK